MAKDRVFQDSSDRASDFEFNEDVAMVFDDMLERSIPFYSEQQSLLTTISRQFWQPGTSIVDLGSSLGTALFNLSQTLESADKLSLADGDND